MAGVRLKHPTLFSCTVVVELAETFMNRKPRWCQLCNKDHDNKSVHLRLDSEGYVFVSPEVLEKLRGVFLAGFDIINEVEKPPVQLVGAVEQPTIHVVENKLNGHTEAAPFYVPGRTKYESRDKMLGNPGIQKVFDWLKKNVKG